MGWSDKTQIAEDLTATDTEVYSDSVTLKSDEAAHVQVEADFPAVPTDNLEVRVYTTLDASSEVWDVMTFEPAQTIVNTTDPNYLSFTVRDVYKFRVGFTASGATDAITVNAWVRGNGTYKDSTLDI